MARPTGLFLPSLPLFSLSTSLAWPASPIFEDMPLPAVFGLAVASATTSRIWSGRRLRHYQPYLACVSLLVFMLRAVPSSNSISFILAKVTRGRKGGDKGLGRFGVWG